MPNAWARKRRGSRQEHTTNTTTQAKKKTPPGLFGHTIEEWVCAGHRPRVEGTLLTGLGQCGKQL